MKKKNIFLGNEICCGTYGFLNTVSDKEIDYKLFEATSSVPFGIRHQKEKDYSRLLTTYCNPDIGIERAVKLWGYRQNKKIFTDSGETAAYILDESSANRCLVGPVDMGRLEYLPVSNLYINMDHYIVIYQKGGKLLCMDSEGVIARKISEKDMKKWLCPSKLPEAGGHITVRTFEKIKGCDKYKREKSAVLNSLEWIQRNMEEAKGDASIEECFRWLEDKPEKYWNLPFLYDISYLIQRKLLQIYWCECVWDFKAVLEKVLTMMKNIIEEQIMLLQILFRNIQQKKDLGLCGREIQSLADAEKNLAEQLCNIKNE